MSLPPDNEQRMGTQDGSPVVMEFFSKWYTQATTYIREARQVTADTLEASHIVLPEQCDPRIRAMLRGEISTDGVVTINRLPITGEHTDGHFRQLLSLFPGWEGVAAIDQAVQSQQPLWLVSIDSTRFSSPIVPGNIALAQAKILERHDGQIVVSGRVTKEGAEQQPPHTNAKFMRYEPADQPHPEGTLLQAQILEVLAQMGGAMAIAAHGGPQEGWGPVFIGLGKTDFAKVHVYPGDLLIGRAQLLEMEGSVSTLEVGLKRGDEEIAHSEELRLAFVPLDPLIERIRREQSGS